MHTTRRFTLALCLTASFLVAGPSEALGDWLVLHDGSRVETAGPWEVRGQLVVFRLASGALSSLRASEVDLEASEAATAAAKEPPAAAEEAPAPRRQPVLVLTDRDVRRAPMQPDGTPEGVAGEVGEEDEGNGPRAVPASQPGTAPRPDRLQVVDWREGRGSDEGLEGAVINGTLLNSSPHIVGQIELTVLLYDAEGDLLASSLSVLGAPGLQPGQRTPFRAGFPGVFAFNEVGFEVDYVALDFDDSPDEGPEG